MREPPVHATASIAPTIEAAKESSGKVTNQKDSHRAGSTQPRANLRDVLQTVGAVIAHGFYFGAWVAVIVCTIAAARGGA